MGIGSEGRGNFGWVAVLCPEDEDGRRDVDDDDEAGGLGGKEGWSGVGEEEIGEDDASSCRNFASIIAILSFVLLLKRICELVSPANYAQG